ADLAAIAEQRPGAPDRCFDVADAGVLVEFAHQSERLLELFGHVWIELDAGLQSPEQVGCEAEIALGCPVVALPADAGVHSENLLDHDNCSARRAFGMGDIGLEAAAPVDRLDVDHLAHDNVLPAWRRS